MSLPPGPPVDGQASPVPAAAPVCPRHPGRESYVRCQRCERPVCPDCQRPAAVGVQCVDCVKAQSKTVRTARTAFGGQVTSGRPLVTLSIIGLCVVGFVLQQVAPGSGPIPSFTSRFAFYPLFAVSEPWRFLTSAFLHSPTFPLHIAFNMYALWLVGPLLEGMFGRARYAAVYLLSAFGGSVGVFLLATPAVDAASWVTPVVGASGAVFGLFGALVVVNRRLGRDNAGIIGVLVINGVIGFVPGLSIAWQGHLGGLITGVLATLVFAFAPRERRALLHPVGLAALAVLLVVLVAAKAASAPAGLV